MKQDPGRRAYAFAIGGGMLLWLATMMVSGRREAWDSGLYWIAAYPLAILLAGWLAYEFPDRAWRWALAIMLSQALTLAVTAGDLSLFPLGLVVFSILALPPIAVAVVVARRTRRREAG